MVNRSLVAKIYAYALIILAIGFFAALGINRMLIAHDRQRMMGQFNEDLAPQALFIAVTLENAWEGNRPNPTRIRELEQRLHLHLVFVPWTNSGPWKTGLAHQKFWLQSRAALEDSHGLWGLPMTGRPPPPPPPGQPDEQPPPPDQPDGPPPPQGPPRYMLPYLHHYIYWVRLDRSARPVGAVRVESVPPPPPPPPSAIFVAAAGLILVLALLLIPPLLIWVVRPLRRMVTVADRLGGGDLETPVIAQSRDEFGHLEAAFENMRARLLQVLEDKERLLLDISHELRSPLARMAVAAKLIGSETPYLVDIEEDMQLMDELIGELLLLARARNPRQLARETVDLATLSAELVEQRQLVCREHGLTLETNLAPASLQGDRRMLARALGNLLDNAIKYTPAGSAISLETGAKAGELFVRVSDSGSGIAAEHLPHIREPFYRPDTSRSRATGGTGLGLAIVEAIVTNHQGTLAIDSDEGKGTEVTMCFPLLNQEDQRGHHG